MLLVRAESATATVVITSEVNNNKKSLIYVQSADPHIHNLKHLFLLNNLNHLFLPTPPSVLSGILSFTTGTTRSRRRSLCTTSPTSPACDQQRLLKSHLQRPRPSHCHHRVDGNTPQSHTSGAEIQLQMLQKPEPWWDIRNPGEECDIIGVHLVFSKFSWNSSCGLWRWQGTLMGWNKN